MSGLVFPAITYGTFFTFMVLAFNQLTKALWSSDERLYYKRRFVNTLKSQQEKYMKPTEDSKMQNAFFAAGFQGMTDFKWLMYRFLIIIFTLIYFLVFVENIMWSIASIIVMFAATSSYKYSPVNFYLKGRANKIQQRKEIELFTLFALLKTDLMASNTNQVNVYHLVSETTSYFKDINYVLVKFLSLWKKSPEAAGAVFQTELSSDTAKFIGDVLSKLHNMDRKTALDLINEQADVFTYKRTELAVQREEKKRFLFFSLFFTASFFGIVWFLYFTYVMVMKNMSF